MPGYIKNVGDHIHMRWVQPGYDPDATDVPPNKVIFDSDDLGTLSVLTFGSIQLPASGGTYRQLVTWDMTFVPLCLIQFEYSGDGNVIDFLPSNPVPYQCRINIRKNGIWGKGSWGVSPNIPKMHYTAFNVKAADG